MRDNARKVLLAVRNMGGEPRRLGVVLDDVIARALRQPDFLVVDGGAGIDKVLSAPGTGVPTLRCTIHEHRKLLARVPRT